MGKVDGLPSVADALVEAFAEMMVSLGVAPDRAQTLAQHRANQFLRRMGGDKKWLPRGVDQTRDAREDRNEAIEKRAKMGASSAELSRAYRMSQSQINKILKARRSKGKNKLEMAG